MSDATRIESVNLRCAEENRTAHLLVTWTGSGEGRHVQSIECDNPKFARLEPWDCRWSCWNRLER